MKKWVDDSYFTELSQAEPERLCANGRAVYDPAAGRYTIRIWHEEHILDGRVRLIQVARSGAMEEAGRWLSVFAIWYLLHPETITLTHDWVSENDFPGGSTFFRGPHLIPTAKISTACGEDLKRFTTACLSLGGEPVTMGDAAFRFAMTPDIAITVVYWLGDEDFPAEAKLRFDKGMVGKLPLDIVFCLACEVCDRLARAAGEGRGVV
jgi:hypothetical protein